MNREQANKILDQIREGVTHSEARTLECLRLTGDVGTYAPVRGTGVDYEVQQKNWSTGPISHVVMVGWSQK